MHLIIGLKATTYVQHRPAPTHVDWFVDNRLLHTDPPSQDQYKYPVAITKGIKTLTKVKKNSQKGESMLSLVNSVVHACYEYL